MTRALRLGLGAASLGLGLVLSAGVALAAPNGFDNPAANNPGFGLPLGPGAQDQTLPVQGGANPTDNPAPAPTPNAAAQASAARRAAQHQAALAATRAASQQRQVNRTAAAQREAQALWQRTGRPSRMIVIRPHVVDVVTAGRLTSRIQRGGGPLNVSQLTTYVPGTWVASSGGTTLLSAAVVLTAGTTLNSSGATIRLAGGATPGSAAAIWVGRGILNLNNVTVTSWDPQKQAPMASSPGRPFIMVGSGGQLRASNATLNNLGAAPGGHGGGDRSGVVFGAGSTGALVRTKLERNQVGLKLSGSSNVRLNAVDVDGSDGDGLVLRGDHGTSLSGVTATGNGGNGVVLSGAAAGRVLSGVSVSGNGAFGVAAERQSSAQISGLSTSGDRSGGIRLTGCTGCSVARTTSSNEPVGLLVNGAATRVTLDHPQVHGGARGLVLDHGVNDVDIEGLAVDHASAVGLAIAASGVQVRHIAVSDSDTAVKISSAASRVVLSSPTIARGNEGVVAAKGARDVQVQNLVAENVGRDAVVTDAQGTVITGGRITGGHTGINARAATTIEGTTIGGAIEGVHATPPASVRATNLDVLAVTSGIKIDPSAQFVLVDSTVQARRAIRGQAILQGHDTISMPPFWWLGGVGVLLVLIAVLLEVAQTLLQRRGGAAAVRPARAPARLAVAPVAAPAPAFAPGSNDGLLGAAAVPGWPRHRPNGRGVNPTVFPVMDRAGRRPDGA
jgi:hypothetical protein